MILSKNIPTGQHHRTLRQSTDKKSSKAHTKRSIKASKDFHNLFEKIEEFEEIQGYAETISSPSNAHKFPNISELTLKQKLDEARKTSITAMEKDNSNELVNFKNDLEIRKFKSYGGGNVHSGFNTANNQKKHQMILNKFSKVAQKNHFAKEKQQ